MSQSSFFEALGWSLIDSLWQVGAIWIFYILFTKNGSRFSAEKRHSLAFGGMMTGSLLFFASIIINSYSAAVNGDIYSLAYFIEQHTGTWFNYGKADAIVSILSFIYLPVLMFYALRLLFQVLTHRNNYKRNLAPVDDEMTEFLGEMISKLGISKRTILWLSDKVASPLTLGFWKPVILLPVALFSHLSYRQIETVIAHELYHIKRNDYLLNIFLTVAEIVLFFNPFAKLLADIVKKERENSCDDLVLAAGFNAMEYSQALYILGRFRQQESKFSLAATGIGKEYLLHRIRRIMKRDNPRPSVKKPLIAFFLCLVVAGFASRNKNVTVLREAVTTPAKQVVYFAAEKDITSEPAIVTSQPAMVPARQRPTTPHKSVDPIQSIAPPPPPPPPSLITITESSADEDVTITFAAAPEVMEFSMLDHAEPEVPETVCETPQPYVPKATFYYTEVDTTAGKTVIRL